MGAIFTSPSTWSSWALATTQSAEAGFHRDFKIHRDPMASLIPVILSGGAGTRLWPLSREMYPKQLLALTGIHTMLQDTAQRLKGIAGATPPIVVCNDAHRFTVAEQIRALQIQPAAILLEPVGRNTAPAVALAALKAIEIDPGATLIVA